MHKEPIATMHRPLIAILASLILAPVASSQQRLVDDFSSGTDSAWTHLDELQRNQLGTTSYTITGGRYRMASSTALPPVSISTGSFLNESQQDQVAWSNGAIRLRVHMENGNTNASVLMRFTYGGYGYFFSLNNYENRLYLGLARPTGTTNFSSTPFAIADQTDYWMEAAYLGDLLSLKVWQHGTTEPVAPQLQYRHGTYAQGIFAMGIYTQPSIGGLIAAQFDDVTFTPYPVVTAYGAACGGGSTLRPTLTAAGNPTRGGNLQLVCAGGSSNGLVGLALGTTQGNVSIGLPCPLLLGNVLEFTIVGLDGAGRGALQIGVPLQLQPMTLTAQGFATTSNPSIFPTTQGLELMFLP